MHDKYFIKPHISVAVNYYFPIWSPHFFEIETFFEEHFTYSIDEQEIMHMAIGVVAAQAGLKLSICNLAVLIVRKDFLVKIDFSRNLIKIKTKQLWIIIWTFFGTMQPLADEQAEKSIGCSFYLI